MFKLMRRGGEAVNGGTYLNFWTRRVFTLDGAGILPGTSSQTYWKVPASLVSTSGLILISIVLAYPSGLFEPYAEKIVLAYAVVGYVFITAVIATLAIIAFSDRLVNSRDAKIFKFDQTEPESETEDLAK